MNPAIMSLSIWALIAGTPILSNPPVVCTVNHHGGLTCPGHFHAKHQHGITAAPAPGLR